MPLCPTCGRDSDDPADWLTPDELDLADFLAARLAEHRDAVEVHTTGRARATAIAAADLCASAAAVVRGFAWTRDPQRRDLLRLPVLLLTQPWVEHPDCRPEWIGEIRDAIGA